MANTIGEPLECNIVRRRGDTKDLRIRVTSNGSNVDVNGWSAFLTINTVKEPNVNVSPVVGQEVFQAVGAPDPTSASPEGSDGIIRFDFGASPSFEGVEPGTYFYDIEVTDGDGEVYTYVIGKFTVKQDITK